MNAVQTCVDLPCKAVPKRQSLPTTCGLFMCLLLSLFGNTLHLYSQWLILLLVTCSKQTQRLMFVCCSYCKNMGCFDFRKCSAKSTDCIFVFVKICVHYPQAITSMKLMKFTVLYWRREAITEKELLKNTSANNNNQDGWSMWNWASSSLFKCVKMTWQFYFTKHLPYATNANVMQWFILP